MSDVIQKINSENKSEQVKSKTYVFGIVICLILVLINGLMIYLTFQSKKSKKECEYGTSFGCPVYSCLNADVAGTDSADLFTIAPSETPMGTSKKITNASMNCNFSPFRFEYDPVADSYTKVCMSYTVNQEGATVKTVNQN